MVFEHIEKLKQQFTDKYVVVDEGCLELRRFNGMTGMIKTVNMNGRALVEFDADNNIGWYDIEIDFLKVIDKPLPKKETTASKPVAKKVAAKAPSNLEKARASDGKKTGTGMEVADVLAAARGAKSETTATSAADPKKMSVADVMAAARGEKGTASAASTTSSKSEDVAAIMEAARKPKEAAAPSTAPAKSAPVKGKDPRSMSVAEMLAAARAEKQDDSATAPTNVSEEPKLTNDEPETDEPETVAPPDSEAVASPAVSGGELPTDVPGIVAFCRQVDGSG